MLQHSKNTVACSVYPFSVQFVLLEVVILTFIHVVVHPFLLLHSIPQIYHGLFDHSPVDGHVSCFQLGAVTDRAAVNSYVKQNNNNTVT